MRTLKTQSNWYGLAKALTDQAWDSIGLLEGPISSEVKKSDVINQLVSILLLQLDVLHTWREYSTPSVATILSNLQNGSTKSTLINSLAHEELIEYVTKICSLYNDVRYHAFNHAAHVTMSMNKLVSMVIQEENETGYGCTFYARQEHAETTQEVRNRFTSTLGIGNDPLTLFALIFSALIHDVGHVGISNRQLSSEGDGLSLLYNDQSVAEQNSLSISFSLLYQEEYQHLLKIIAPDIEQRRAFRKLVIHTVMCTDIASPDRTQLMKTRWKEAFELSPRKKNQFEDRTPSKLRFGIKRAMTLTGSSIDFYTDNEIELKASSVLEQMMLASDVAHLFQSYDNFLKWNERLYLELWKANLDDRGFNPSISWYGGQITFIDNYVRHLAERLSICDVFGENGPLFTHNLSDIRRKWQIEGDQFCKELIRKCASISKEEVEEFKDKASASVVTDCIVSVKVK